MYRGSECAVSAQRGCGCTEGVSAQRVLGCGVSVP